MVSHLGHQVMKRSPVTYNLRKRQSQTVGDCTTQSLYKSPVEDQIVDSAQKLTVDWDTNCFTTDTVDIKLYLATSTNATERRIRFYKGVPNKAGGIQLPLYSRWWHNAPTVDLYLMIQEGGEPFPGMYGPGPTFTATYDGAANSGSDMSIVDEGYTYFKNLIQGLSGGQIAGAVIGCILFVGLLIGSVFFVRRARAKRAAQSKRFSQMVDKRMSTISQNWSSISPSAAQAAIRNSMAVYGRPSGDVNMQSSLSVNAATGHAHPGNTVGTGLRPQRERTTSRATRVSFAPESMYGTTGRPSSSIRNSTASGLGRANYFNDTDAPPVPARKSTLGAEITLSPTQAAGALALSPSDVDYRASQYNEHGDVAPALSMMRESDGSDHPMYYAPRVETPLPPVPAATSAKSPVGMMPMLDSSMSPDALMRAYSSKNKVGLRLNTMSIATSGASASPVSSSGGAPAYPTPAATRTVYTPQSAAGSNPFRKSVAASVASGFSPYDGMEDDEPAASQQRSTRF